MFVFFLFWTDFIKYGFIINRIVNCDRCSGNRVILAQGLVIESLIACFSIDNLSSELMELSLVDELYDYDRKITVVLQREVKILNKSQTLFPANFQPLGLYQAKN
jgi:hypothetical protein